MQRLLIPFANVFFLPLSSFSSSHFSCSSPGLQLSLFWYLELGRLPTHLASGSLGMSAVNFGGWCISLGRLDITLPFGDGLLLYLCATAAFLKYQYFPFSCTFHKCNHNFCCSSCLTIVYKYKSCLPCNFLHDFAFVFILSFLSFRLKWFWKNSIPITECILKLFKNSTRFLLITSSHNWPTWTWEDSASMIDFTE